LRVGTDPLGWVVEDAGLMGGWNEGRGLLPYKQSVYQRQTTTESRQNDLCMDRIRDKYTTIGGIVVFEVVL